MDQQELPEGWHFAVADQIALVVGILLLVWAVLWPSTCLWVH